MRVERGKPDSAAERRRKAQALKRRQEAERNDVEIINRLADKLNAEAEDVLGYQVIPHERQT